MARNTAILAIKIISDAKGAAKGFSDTENSVGKFEKATGRAQKGALAVTTGLVGLGFAARDQASQLEQSAGAVDSVFKTQANAVHDLARNAAEAFGLSRNEYSQTASVFGAQLKNMQVSAKDLVPTTDELIGLGADLAATFGGPTKDAVEAIGSLLRGERDPIERYGVSIKQADITSRMAADGTDKLTGAAKKAAETEATLALLYEQTADAQGQRSREADMDATRQEVAMAKVKNAAAQMGAVLLPVFASAASAAADVAGWAEKNSTLVQILAGVVGGLAVGILALNAGFKAYRATMVAVNAVKAIYNAQVWSALAVNAKWQVLLTAQAIKTRAVAAAQGALNLAMKLNPIGLIVVAVVALIAGLVLLYKRSEAFRNAVDAAGRAGRAAIGWVVDKARDLWNRLKSVADRLGGFQNIIKTAFKYSPLGSFINGVKRLVNWVKDVVAWVKRIKFPEPPGWMKAAGRGVSAVFGSYVPPNTGARYALVPSVSSAPGQVMAATPGSVTRRVGGGGGSAFVQITINGALDPVGVADQLDTILRRRGLRLGVRR